ncbi:MAG: hypothetical protein QNK23_12425 [Crocinitomicaceae bacterium]|nr:hypothetical protein [Crocinitomicaceae bacterium]
MGLRALLFGILIVWSGTGMAQVSYSNNREKFVKEFQKALNEYGKGEFHDFAKKEFPEILLETSQISDEYFNRMVETLNLMITKKLKPYPEQYNYVYSVTALIQSGQSSESYDAWHSSVDKMLDSRNVKKFKGFVELSAGFFSESRLATASNFEWFYIGGEYTFEFDKKPFIKFTGGNLVCRVASKKQADKGKIIDSLEVINTSGTYDPVLKKWVGEGGTITWEKVGLDPTKTFAGISAYDVSLKSSTLRIDTVSLTTPYFSDPIKGMMTERAFIINREEDKVYPQFLSFERRLLIKDLVENVDYIGGFALQGERFVGAGTNSEQAQITYNREGNPFMRVQAKEIYVSPTKITVQKARFAMFLQSGDSITHPGIGFTYDLENKRVLLVRAKTGIGTAPFQDSYHQLEVYVPKILWEVDSDNLEFTYEFGTSQDQKVATFESRDYFNEQVYDRLQAMSADHPLVMIWQYCYKFDEFVLNEGQAATALGMTVSQAKTTLLNLSNMGFIAYDTESKIVVINKKLQTFVQAKSGKIDYDNLVFKCDLRPKELKGYTQEQIDGDEYLTSIFDLYAQQNEDRRIMKNFGVMSLTTLDLSLEAVDHVVISDVKNTVVFPDNSEVLIKANRNFNFSGWMNSGKLEIKTKAANFNYEEYKFNILSSEEAIFRVRPLRQEDGMKPIPMVSSLSGITGEIFVDSPDNRSGKKVGEKYAAFPKLVSTTETKIFYNSRDIFRGVYDSTRFYYTVEPFKRDSLNGFNERKFRLQGELTSAGIFPKINEPIKIMPDYSFGFATEAPSGGYQFYGTEANYENKIVLSHNGLQGAGTINFVHSTSVSKTLFSFLPDSTVGIVQFENKPIDTGVEFPDVTAADAYMTYIPKQNILKAQSSPQNEMVFFGGEAKMRGMAIVRPTGMTGTGLMTFSTANLVSTNFRYKRYEILADTAGFSLKNESMDAGENALAFKTDNVNAEVSFKDRKGVFKSNEGESVVEFPVNQYMCKMDQFSWLMDDHAIELESQEQLADAATSGVDLVGPNFFSTHPKQDSLQFRAPKARFDLKEKTIYCSEVEYVDIADARIYPDSMKLNIRKKAKIDKLINARIVANYITEYHKFEEAEVQIKARRDYEAIGLYPYYDVDSNVTYIAMNDIGLDTSYQTRASGEIAADAGFKLSAEFDYYGSASIKAAKPEILFSGATRINHGCVKFDRNWMAFTSEVDPKNIQIPVSDEMKDLDGGAISAGIVWRNSMSTDSLAMYPTFLSALVSEDDPIVITASGYLQYDAGAQEFQIGPREKLLNRNEPGNYIALHTESCSMNGDGVINLGMDYGDMTVDAVGVVNYDQATGITDMNITARFNMPIDKGLMQDVAERIAADEGLAPIAQDWFTNTLEKAIVEWDSRKEADKMMLDYSTNGEIKKVPDGLDYSMIITDIRLTTYNSQTNFQRKGLVTSLESASLVSIFGKPVMKQIPFRAFFEQTYANADRFQMYMNIPGGRDYFFSYKMDKKDGTLSILTGDQEFKTGLTEMKEEKRKKKNFKYQSVSNNILITKFIELFAD